MSRPSHSSTSSLHLSEPDREPFWACLLLTADKTAPRQPLHPPMASDPNYFLYASISSVFTQQPRQNTPWLWHVLRCAATNMFGRPTRDRLRDCSLAPSRDVRPNISPGTARSVASEASSHHQHDTHQSLHTHPLATNVSSALFLLLLLSFSRF